VNKSTRLYLLSILLGLAATLPSARGEAMLELFNVPWAQLTTKMPEIAEAGYDSLWVPNPGKGNSGSSSYGYDMFDPFDLGSTNQQGTVATRWGTQAQLLQMVATAHRFGIRVYFDNVMNHRASTVPGYPGSGTATNYYPGLVPQDFHLQTVSGGWNNWPSIGDPYWCTTSVVQNQPLLGLCDLAQEPGTVNWNYGNSVGNTANKPYFVRFPGRNDLYMDTNLPSIGGSFHPFDGNGQPVNEYVQDYLCRNVAWTVWMTKCDGFRLDAVKHVPVGFFGAETGQTDDSSFSGYTGAIQAMYDYVHGYGTNVSGNGYVETDGNRNSLFNTETTRNDAMIFGEHVSPAPAFADYLNSGMRLQNQPLYSQMNNVFGGGGSVAGMDGRDYYPNYSNCDGSGNFSAAQAVNFPMNQDYGYNANLGLEDAYLFMREGLPMAYSDGYNHNFAGGTPVVSYANYLGEYSDNSLPETVYIHNNLARGGTHPRWSDTGAGIIAFERYDYREGSNTQPQTQTVSLTLINTKSGGSADITFDDGVAQTSDGYYGGISVTSSKGQGLAVGFAPGSVLVQLAGSSPTGGRAYQKLLVHQATTNSSAAQASVNATDPTQRLIYVGSQTIPSGGGAIELNVPTQSWLIYGYQWPEASRANLYTNAITFLQGGNPVPHLTVNRTDGANGDTNGFNPAYPFKMRGSVDQYGNVIGGVHVSNLTYAIDIPVVTNANFDIIARCDSSCANTLLKLDGGIDLNSQMGIGPTNLAGRSSDGLAPTNFLDLRDNKPGYADDRFLGYEQTLFQYRDNPEKFAAKNTLSNTIVSLGAETYYYTVGSNSSSLIVSGSGYGQGVGQTAAFVYHDPADVVTATNNLQSTQRVPLVPTNSQTATIYVKIGYANYINTCFVYYTTDGSNPEGAFGVGKGTTQVVHALYLSGDTNWSSIDWWRVTIPGQPAGTQVRYKFGAFYGGSGGSIYAGGNAAPAPDSDTAKCYGVYQAAITNFNPVTATVWQHNDLNPANAVTGLQSGFHIVRARTYLPRTGQSSVYNTFSQTFYYDGALPTGAIAYPANGSLIGSSSYTAVVRADSTVTGVDFQIQDSNPLNDDSATGRSNGNGTNVWVAATAVSPNSGISATYTNLPQEYRFVYTNIPSSGTAQIIVRLKEFASGVYTNRITLLTNNVTTLAPQQIVSIATPATNGMVLTYRTNLSYLVQACFSSTLIPAQTNFTILINGSLQPQANYYFSPVNGNLACPGYRAIEYTWNNPPAGVNTIEVDYTNGVVPISDTRSITVSPPVVLSPLASNNQLVAWTSAPGVNYQVLATTNLAQPFTPISDPIPASGSTTFFYDPNPLPQKFYEVIQLP
jgi:glycosidase/archaellum component FlaG (FlaF/FlaG flagellin family)